jgi:hypothetical protein
MARKAGTLPGPGKELPAANIQVTATVQTHGIWMVDIGKVPGIDIPSGDFECAEAW